MHTYTTHICKTPDNQCKHCLNMIPIDAEFAVTSTPSKTFQINCLICTDQRLDAGEKGLRIDNTVGDNPGSMRAAA